MNDQIPKVDTVLLKVASRCNIDCKYCYVYHASDQQWRNQPARMSDETIETSIQRLKELKQTQNRDIAVVLHGGEPLLLGYSRLKRLLTGMRSALGSSSTLALQTNGTLLTSEFMELFADTRTRLSVSIDGPKDINDKFRIDHKSRSTFNSTVSAIRKLLAHPRNEEFFYGVLAVVDSESDPKEVYAFFKSLQVDSVDFLYKDGNYDQLPKGKSNLLSVEYGAWMARVWDLYVADEDPIAIECLDNLVRGVFGKEPTKEGSGDSNYGILIVDTDGSIAKNDTLKNSFNGADRFNNNWTIFEHSFAMVMESEEYLNYVSGQAPQNQKCKNCPILGVCGGGMMLHRWSSLNGYDNPSIYCADQTYLINHIMGTLKSLVA